MRIDEPADPPYQPAGAGRDPALADTSRTAAARPGRRWQIGWKRMTLILLALLALIIIWLAFTAPLSKSLEPMNAPSLTILSAEGEPIARRGAVIGEPVSAAELPDHVTNAFLAIEDRRFYNHFGIDPLGIGRAVLRNLRAGGVREGGSTITQQLAKTSFLSHDRTAGRKLQEALIAVWLEAWLSKQDILGRYLSNVYFGDNVYGLRAAARHYFNRAPEDLTVPEAAMLAGMVNAPSRLAPTRNLEGAQERSRLVMRAMVEAGMLDEAEKERLSPARVRPGGGDDVPTGTYFADWVLPEASELAEAAYGERRVQTTLEGDLQRLAVRTVRGAGLGRAQVALVAMRRDGRVVAMVGGKNYAQSPFNRATQARRQSGSTFKLFVYLAAFRAGMSPDMPIEDTPLRLGDWAPENHGGQYRGRISIRDAVAVSSNVAAVRVQERVGRQNVIRAARDLGVASELTEHPSLALGTSGLSLLEMTAAYASVASGRYPIRPRGLPQESRGWLGRWWPDAGDLNRDPAFRPLRDVLFAAVNGGTGRAAALQVPAFGKTGTTQTYRDALFIGWADDLVVGVWIGNDDNSPLPGIAGGGQPARIWRDFMAAALGTEPVPTAPSVPLTQTDADPEPAADPGEEPVLIEGAEPPPPTTGEEPPVMIPPIPGQRPAPPVETPTPREPPAVPPAPPVTITPPPAPPPPPREQPSSLTAP